MFRVGTRGKQRVCSLMPMSVVMAAVRFVAASLVA
jgi:hypothetical protein